MDRDTASSFSAHKNGNVTFLSPNKKVTKEVGIGEALKVALSSAPRAAFGGCALHAPAGAAARPSRPLLCTSPGTHLTAADHLRVAPVRAKSVPTFCPKCRCEEKSGGQGERSPCHRFIRIAYIFNSIRSTRLPSARRGFPKGASLIAGAINSAPLWTASFGTFLAGARKVHTQIFIQNYSSNC